MTSLTDREPMRLAISFQIKFIIVSGIDATDGKETNPRAIYTKSSRTENRNPKLLAPRAKQKLTHSIPCTLQDIKGKRESLSSLIPGTRRTGAHLEIQF